MNEALEFLLREEGLWAERRRPVAAGSPALFLDRDGVIVEERHYLHRIEDVTLTPCAATTIGRMNRAGIPVVVITNQGGIGRGFFSWEHFRAVQEEMHRQLEAAGAHVDAVYACAYHADGQPPFALADHAWRKPNPGMPRAAAADLAVDLSRSSIVGDRASDLEAGKLAGLRGGILVETGYGAGAFEIAAALSLTSDAFEVGRAIDLGRVAIDFDITAVPPGA